MKHALILTLICALLVACGGKEAEKGGGDKPATKDSGAVAVDTGLPKGMERIESTDKVEVEVQGKPLALVRITKPPGDAFTVCAGLQTAEELSSKFAVVVYFDLRGVATVLKATPDFEFAPYPKAKAQLKKLRSLGVELVVSNTALSASYAKPEDLEPGVKISNLGEVLSISGSNSISIEF